MPSAASKKTLTIGVKRLIMIHRLCLQLFPAVPRKDSLALLRVRIGTFGKGAFLNGLCSSGPHKDAGSGFIQGLRA